MPGDDAGRAAGVRGDRRAASASSSSCCRRWCASTPSPTPSVTPPRRRGGAAGDAGRAAARGRCRGRRLGARRQRPAGHPMVPDGFSFAGRPQLAARFAGRGGGRTLLLNGHVDVVSVEPRDRWRHDPFAGVVADGAVHGRGTCDMKGGVACMVLAAETLQTLGVPLAGDVIVNTVTEEESTGAGGLAMAHALHADGAIVPEPSGFDVWIACRGSLLPRITVRGPCRARGHRTGASRSGRRRERDREDGDPARRHPPAARGVGAATAAPVPVAGRRVPTIIAGRRVARLVPGQLHARRPHRVPARAGGRARLRLARGGASSWTGSRARPPPIRGSRPTRRASSGCRARCRRPRCRRTIRSSRPRSAPAPRSVATGAWPGSTTGTTAPR